MDVRIAEAIKGIASEGFQLGTRNLGNGMESLLQI